MKELNKKNTIILALLLLTFQSFCQEETKQSFGAQVCIAASFAYPIGTLESGLYTLEGVGTCFSLNYKHDIINSRFRISPAFQVGFYSGDSEVQTSYTTTSMLFNFECDAIRYKSFNVMIYGGGGILSGSGISVNQPLGYTNAAYSYGIGFRYEPKDSPISITLQPYNYQLGSVGDILSANLGFDIHF